MITLTDLFCGAGGSSTGAVQVPGVQVRVASNHWQLAVDTHEANHPDTGHVCADLSQIDPRYYPKTDILWASPECTNHSIAKGGARDIAPDLFNQMPNAAAERSRATMWDVPRFTEAHRYSIVIVENVVDVARWAPYGAWLEAMGSLGYAHEVVYMNSMHAWASGDAAPQSRDRFYAVFWRKGNRRPDLHRIQCPPAWCPDHGRVEAIKMFKNTKRWGRFKSQYVFRCPHTSCRGREVTPDWMPASSIIDWTDTGTRIGDRPRPLAEKTMKRIQAGIDRYWSGPKLDPLVVNNVSGSDSTRSTSVHEVAPTMVAGGLHASLLVPVEGRNGKTARSVTEAYRTQTTRNETGLLVASGHGWDSGPTPLGDPSTPRIKRGTEGVAFPPFIAELRGGSSDARPVAEPLSTATASGNHHALVTSEIPTIDDCSFRMLSPNEISRAMAFPVEYQMLGTKRDQVRLAGNAVTPPAARDLVAACAESLGVAA